MPSGRTRIAALAVAAALLIAIDLTIARLDVFGPLVPDSRPTSLFAGINRQLTDVVRAFYGRPPGPPPVVFVGNSLLEAAVRPLGLLEQRLTAAGAPPGTRALSLCVFATEPTDAEVIARHLGQLRPGLVVLGLGAPDLGTPLERARSGPVTHLLDTGFRDGLVPPADWETRLDRWVRTTWRLYRYRSLLHDLVLPPAERRTSAALLEQVLTPAALLEASYGPEEAHRILELRAIFDRSGEPADFARYVEALRGPDYLPGLRSRWHDLEPQPLQLEALHRFVDHVRAAGGRPAWLLLPENPLLARDPEVGAEVSRRSDAVAARLASEATALDVPLIDLRHALPASAFLDFNHLLTNSAVLFPTLQDALGARHLLDAGTRTARATRPGQRRRASTSAAT